MGQLRGFLPLRELSFCIFWIFWDEFDYSLRLRFTVLYKEYGTMVRATQVLTQVEPSTDDLAFPLFPSFGHPDSPPITT